MEKFFHKVKEKDQNGMILVMAIMILSIVLTSVLALSQIIMGELKMSLNAGNSILAFYSAESGIEKGLYYIKYSRENSDFSDFIKLSYTTSYNVDDLGNKKFVISTSTILGGVTDFYGVSTTSPAYLDIMDPAGAVGIIDWSASVGLPSYTQIFWEIENCFPLHASDKLEVTINSFAQEFSDPKTETRIAICNCGYGDDDCDISSYSNISPNRYYHFSFRPLDSEIKELNFRMRNAANAELKIMSSALIEAYGEYSNSRYRLQATVPTLNPVSDVFSYVLFSEEDLTKGL
ncbi:hypothetical protein C4566_00675 [Candidatus Parcubacteria bacterium]|nr:MAG: hypothetical protein C4566_00675 [Candidatus Parcubacteria bacterium]